MSITGMFTVNMAVCRLCCDTELIVDMFDESIDNYKLRRWRYLILTATGVHIRKDDIVSKMVCHMCCDLVEKLYKYRQQAVNNDKLLKEQLGQMYLPPVTDPKELQRIGERILNETDCEAPNAVANTSSTTDVNHTTKESVVVPEIVNRHDSVKKVIVKYPGIKLPEEVNRCDVNPDVTLDRNEVRDWYQNYLERYQQRLSLANIVIRRVKTVNNKENNNNSNNNENNNNSNCVSKVNVTIISAPLEEPVLKNLPPKELSSTSLITTDETPSIIRPCPLVVSRSPPVNKPLPNKPCPKSKKVKLPPQITTNDSEESSSLELQQSISTVIDKVLGSSDTLKTQINHISTTTTDTALVKKKRKPRKKLQNSDCLLDEIVPNKKQRINCSKNSISPHEKLDIPDQIQNDTTLLESNPVPKETESSHDQVFICKHCLKVYDTSKELRVHQRRHLTCKFCRLRMPSMKRLLIHENQSCPVKIMDNPPQLRLTRVDEIQSVLDRYPNVFRSDDVVCISDSDDDSPPEVNRSPVKPKIRLSSVIVSKPVGCPTSKDIVKTVTPNKVVFQNSGTKEIERTPSSLETTDVLQNRNITTTIMSVANPINSLLTNEVTISPVARTMLTNTVQKPNPPVQKPPSPVQKPPSPLHKPPSPLQKSPPPVQKPPPPVQKPPPPVHKPPPPVQKPPPPYQPTHKNKTVITTSSQRSPLDYSAAPGKTPANPREYLFTDAELMEMFNMPITSDLLPNTKFHHTSTLPAPTPTPKQPTMPKTDTSSKQTSSNPTSEISTHYMPAPNTTVHDIPKPAHTNSSELQQNTSTFANNLELTATPEYLQSDLTPIPILYQRNATQASEWLQQSMAQDSAIQMTNENALELMQQYIAAETVRQLKGVTHAPPPSYRPYQPSSLEQMNYNNAQYPYTCAQYNPSSYSTNITNSMNAYSGNQTNHIASYTSVGPTANNQHFNTTPNPMLCTSTQNFGNANLGANGNPYTVPINRHPQTVSQNNNNHTGYGQSKSSQSNVRTLPKAMQKSNSNRNQSSTNVQYPNSKTQSPKSYNQQTNRSSSTTIPPYYSHSSSAQPPNRTNSIPNTAQYPMTSPNQAMNRSSVVSQYASNPQNYQSTNVRQYSMSSPNNLSNIQNVQQSINGRRFSNPVPSSNNMPNLIPGRNSNPSPSSSHSTPTANIGSLSGLSSPTEPTPAPKGVLRVKNVWELL